MRKFKVLLMLFTLSFLTTCLIGCSGKPNESKKIILGTGPRYEPIIELLKKELGKKGYEVELKVFSGNHVPATACNEGDIDGLVYNHVPWIEKFDKETGADLVTVEPYIFYARTAMYSLKHKSLEYLPDNATIALPGDPTNLELSLKFLEDNKLITLGEKKGDFYTLVDIVENPKKLNLLETEITETIRSIEDADAVIVGVNGARDYGLNVDDFLAENMHKKDFPTGLVVKEGSKDDDWVKAAQEIIKSEEFRDGFNEKYEGVLVLY
ncbi:MetQ/NlpA family ABC transporter substrate-binding protein [Lagierella sp.]|uniref:MetQ/NlpA family ABC transporter substrate-binding protein n=1 Tax=Lagierella sp. TaxID=2849657 RepID=UPI0026322C2B|nr:MetQ/NlpA family ABC transporter substrate-binding protein [Lagierella sp.]